MHDSARARRAGIPRRSAAHTIIRCGARAAFHFLFARLIVLSECKMVSCPMLNLRKMLKFCCFQTLLH